MAGWGLAVLYACVVDILRVIKGDKNKDGSVLTLKNICFAALGCVWPNRFSSFRRILKEQAACSSAGKKEGNVQAWLCSTVVGVRVPGTDGTSQPLICRIVCRGRVCECAHVKCRESTFWVRWETGRHDNSHLLARTWATVTTRGRVGREAVRQTDWLSAPTHSSERRNPDNEGPYLREEWPDPRLPLSLPLPLVSQTQTLFLMLA